MESHIVEETPRVVQNFLRVAERPRTNEGSRGPASSRANVSFCMTRFDALVDPLIVIFQRMLKPLFATLTEEESEWGVKNPHGRRRSLIETLLGNLSFHWASP